MANVIDSINNIRTAVLAIEQELGINPKKVYGNVRARLDILENRINNPSTPTPSTDNPFFIGTSGITISAGTGYPTSSESSGSIYLRSDGNISEKLYISNGSYWSKVNNLENYLLTGNAAAGGSIDLLLPDNSKLSINDDDSCLCTLKILIVNTTGTKTRAYFERKCLISQEAGVLSINQTSSTNLDNSTGWSITISVVSNELSVVVDAFGSDDRKAECVVEFQRLNAS